MVILYRWMGTVPRGYLGVAESPEPMQQISLELTPLHTRATNFLRRVFDRT
jgi:hypothetical protein